MYVLEEIDTLELAVKSLNTIIKYEGDRTIKMPVTVITKTGRRLEMHMSVDKSQISLNWRD